MKTRLEQVLDAIDRANAKDPNLIPDGNAQRPSELVYGERMSETLDRFCSTASDHLRIAARAQHIERWTSARNPEVQMLEDVVCLVFLKHYASEFIAKRQSPALTASGVLLE